MWTNLKVQTIIMLCRSEMKLVFHRDLVKHACTILYTPTTGAFMMLWIRGFIKKFHLNRFIDKTFGSYYREVYSKNVTGYRISIGFAQKSRWAVRTLYLPG